MDRDCGQTQERLIEVAGDGARLDETSRRHLGECAACRRAAADEAALGRLLERAVPPDDGDLVAHLVAASRFARRRRRLIALVPVVASASVGAAGAVLVGGLPGVSLFGVLPDWSAQGWVALLAACRDWATVLGALARNAPAVLSTAAMAGAGLVALGGGLAALISARRWGAVASWSRRG